MGERGDIDLNHKVDANFVKQTHVKQTGIKFKQIDVS